MFSQFCLLHIKDCISKEVVDFNIQAFSDALTVEKVSVDDDFFSMGGNSISAAYVSFKLGIHMKLIYTFPTPMRLQMALLSSRSSLGTDAYLGELRGVLLTRETRISNSHWTKPRRILSLADSDSYDNYNPAKKIKTVSDTCIFSSKEQNPRDSVWNPAAVHTECSFSRCNKSTHGGQYDGNCSCDTVWSNNLPSDGKGFMRELWKVGLDSCVDASPLLVCKERDIYLFIGAHSHKFVCLDGNR